MEPSPQKPPGIAGPETARLAYDLWERAGRPAGRDEEFWLEAERQIAASVRAPAVQHAPRPSLGGRTPATRPAERKPPGWPAPPLAKKNGRNSAKSPVSQTEPRLARASAD
jgi:hypothetical protein